MASTRIFVICPDYGPPAGGIRKLYRHVDILNAHGLPAAILHSQEGFRCNWFENQTPVSYRQQVVIGHDDVVVVPEIVGPELGPLAPHSRKIIFNQNAYLTFAGYSVDPNDRRTLYDRPDVVGAFVVSADNRAYLSYAFPRLRLFRLHYGIDGHLFAPCPKQPLIAFMPRKNAADVVQVINLLKHRNTLSGFELLPIDGRPEAEVASLLGKCAVFLSFGHPEGCPLPPLEAMSCGCVVVGYHGRGGREYFREDMCYPVEMGDVVGFARQVETALDLWRHDPRALAVMGERAAEYVRNVYTLKKEEEDILEGWRRILSSSAPRAP